MEVLRKISLDNVEPGMVVNKPVLGFLGQVLLNADVTINAKHIYYLKQMGINTIYVNDDRLSDVEAEDLVSYEVRSESRAQVAKVMKDLDAAGPQKKGLVIKDKEILTVVTKIIEELINNQDTLFQLSDIRAQDGYLFAHSVNCCVLSTFIAAKMNYDIKTLRQLATGALLHDIGLVAVPQMILKKPGPLDDEEYDAVKKHPLYGFEIFKSSTLFSEQAGNIILQHHERNNGQGYPTGLRGKNISELARIVAVADVYDALTSDKSYRDAVPAHEALEKMTACGGEMFDPDVLKTFLANTTAFPLGSHVLLDNGESGVVIRNTAGYSLRPVIRLLYKQDLTPHPAPYDLDLDKVLDISIVKVVN